MHPVVSRYITKMICDGTQFPIPYLELNTFQNWWATLDKSQMSLPIQNIHSLYTLRYSQENWIVASGEDRRIFLTALEQFVKLKCVVFTDVAVDENCREFPRPTWPLRDPEGDL